MQTHWKTFTDAPVVMHEDKGYMEVKQGDQVIQMPLLESDSDYFFKVKDLTKLGYKVEWQADFNAIRITK